MRNASNVPAWLWRSKPASPGQVIVLFVLAVVGMLAMAGLVIDGGNAYAQQRATQNGADAAAEAGAVQLARRMAGLPGTEAEWDQRVGNAVNATASANGLTGLRSPEYTDVGGAVLGPVGTGSIPQGTQGVRAGGDREFRTYLAGVIGLDSITASAEAIAVTGYAEESGVGGVIPLTFPVILTQCETGGGSNRLVFQYDDREWPFGQNNMVAIPLCSNGPGNVGWIDWDPPYGGASDVAASILAPDNPPITTPKWYFVAETGGVVSLDDEMDTWEGKDVLIPIFYAEPDDPATAAIDESILGTCDTQPNNDMNDLNDCPSGHTGGTGQNQWYYLVTFGVFHLEHSYIRGNHQSDCNDPTLAVPATAGSGNLLNNCLIGYFKDRVIARNMTVGSGPSSSEYTPLAIQLIR